MTTLNERIKEVRKHFKLSQKDFAKELGISQRALSWGEQPNNNVPDSTIKALCVIFHVNEEWLRNGKGDMLQSDCFDLNQYLKEKGCTELEMEIIKTYFEFDANTRQKVFEHFHSRLEAAKKNMDNNITPQQQPRLAVVQSSEKSERAKWEQEAQEFAKMAYEQFLQEKRRESQALSAPTSDTG